MSYGDSVPQHTHNSYDVYGAADERHSHYDIEDRIDGVRSDLNGLHEWVAALQEQFEEVQKELKEFLAAKTE